MSSHKLVPHFRGNPPFFIGMKPPIMKGKTVPMFSQRQYKVLAACIAKVRKHPPEAQLSALIGELMDKFEADNTQFSRFKFFEACTKGDANGNP